MPKVDSPRLLTLEALQAFKPLKSTALPLVAGLRPLPVDQPADSFEANAGLIAHLKDTSFLLAPTPNPALMAQHTDERRYIRAPIEAPLFARAGPSPDDVRQGLLGSCYLLSALSALAQNDPQAIRDLIEKNQDGTYTVRLYRATEGMPRRTRYPSRFA